MARRTVLGFKNERHYEARIRVPDDRETHGIIGAYNG
jgi:hypothetical protein